MKWTKADDLECLGSWKCWCTCIRYRCCTALNDCLIWLRLNCSCNLRLVVVFHARGLLSGNPIARVQSRKSIQQWYRLTKADFAILQYRNGFGKINGLFAWDLGEKVSNQLQQAQCISPPTTSKPGVLSLIASMLPVQDTDWQIWCNPACQLSQTNFKQFLNASMSFPPVRSHWISMPEGKISHIELIWAPNTRLPNTPGLWNWAVIVVCGYCGLVNIWLTSCRGTAVIHVFKTEGTYLYLTYTEAWDLYSVLWHL